MYVHADPSVNITHPKGTVFKFRFILAKKTYCGSPTLIFATRHSLAIVIIDDSANVFLIVLSQTKISFFLSSF